MNTLIIAHRGASKLARENTLDAFQKAIELGADMIEADVRKTRDDVLVTFHNPDYAGARLNNISYANLAEISRGEVPMLTQVLDLCRGKIRLNLELKESGYPELIGGLLQNRFDLKNLLLTSFSEQAVLDIKKLFPPIRIGLIIGSHPNAFGKIFKLAASKAFAAKFDILSVRASHWRYGTYRLLPLTNKTILVWTVDRPKNIQNFLARPEISGIITNRPDLALQLRSNFNDP